MAAQPAFSFASPAQPDPDAPLSDERLDELDAFMDEAVYGTSLSCLEADQRTRWAVRS